MPLPAKNRVLVVTFALIAGAGIGFTGSTLAYRELLQQRSDQAFKQMVSELRLTPSQQQELREIVAITRGNIGAARRQFEQVRHRLIVEAYRRMRAQLSPEQQTLLDKDFVSPALLAEVKAGKVAPTADASPLSVTPAQ